MDCPICFEAITADFSRCGQCNKPVCPKCLNKLLDFCPDKKTVQFPCPYCRCNQLIAKLKDIKKNNSAVEEFKYLLTLTGEDKSEHIIQSKCTPAFTLKIEHAPCRHGCRDCNDSKLSAKCYLGTQLLKSNSTGGWMLI